MSKLPLIEAIGQHFNHKRLGDCEVIEILSVETSKVKVRITDTNEEKTLLFTPQFFDGAEDYETAPIQVVPKRKHNKVHRPVDLSKYRNHPLVKEIDRKESRSRVIIQEPIVEEEDEPDLLDD